MKITELKCTACNGTLKIDENNPHIAVCEYCGTSYMIEGDENQDFHLIMEEKKRYQTKADKAESVSTGWEAYGWKRGILVVSLLLLFIGVRIGIGIISRSNTETVNGNHQTVAAVETNEKKEPFKGLFALTAGTALGKPAGELTENDLAAFKWLELTYTKDSVNIGYSFQNPDDENASLEWISYPREGAELGMDNLKYFKGLTKLNLNLYIKPEMIEGLSLVSLGCNVDSPADISAYSGAANLKELILKSNSGELEGLTQFRSLESLTIEDYKLTDIKDLVQIKTLKSLTLNNCDLVKDFSVISVMPGLESLSVDSEGLRDISFLSSLTNLKSLSLSDGQMLDVNVLKEKTDLVSLSIIDCGELKDLSGIEGITGLKELSLEVPYDCPQPSLSQMTGLTKLFISGANDVSFLQNMASLEQLEIDRCEINSKDAFLSLSGLKKLVCTNIRGDLSDWSFINQIPGLEVLDLSGNSTYVDISGVFSIPSLQQLYLNGVECEIDFSHIKPNPSLKILEMDGIKLYTNVSISGGGGISYVDYDDVSLDSNLNFLTNFPGLKSLSIADNTLTGIGFAPQLELLEELNIDGNYVTDLKPLTGLANLKTLFCEDNPIDNYRVLSDKTVIVK